MGRMHTRTRWIGASTKMYLGYRQSVEWMSAVAEAVASRPPLPDAGIRPFAIPSFPVLESALRLLSPVGVAVGAQTVSAEHGAATGEVSAPLLAEMGVEIVEIGHAERRARYGETEEAIATKTAVSLAAGLTPLLCVGERDEGDADAAVHTVVHQCRSAVGNDPQALTRIVVAYEPVWAIGAAEPAAPAHVSRVVAGARSELAAFTGASAPPIIYGGSAGPGLLAQVPEVDGLFLGRFAHDPANFARVLDEALSLA